MIKFHKDYIKRTNSIACTVYSDEDDYELVTRWFVIASTPDSVIDEFRIKYTKRLSKIIGRLKFYRNKAKMRNIRLTRRHEERMMEELK